MMNAKKAMLFPALCVLALLALWLGCTDSEKGEVYTLHATASPAEGGFVSPATFLDVASGATVTVSATAKEGYEFVGWERDSGVVTIANPSSGRTAVTVGSDAAIIAKFELKGDTPPPPDEPETYTLVAVANPATGGSVTPAIATDIDSGAVVNVSAVADSCYEFTDWAVASGEVDIADPESASTTVTVFSDDAVIEANFEWVGCDTPPPPPETYTLVAVASPDEGGTVSPTTLEDIASGTQVTLSATAADGYEFAGWTKEEGDIVIDSPSSGQTVVIVRSDAIITANFELQATDTTPPPPPPDTYTLDVLTNPDTGGTVIPADRTNVTVGVPVDISATAASGYKFAGWTVSEGRATVAAPDNATTTVTVSGTATVTANFEREAQQSTFTVTFDTDGGTPSTIDAVTVDNGGTVRGFPENPTKAGYAFDGWYDGATRYAADTRITKDVTLTARWVVEFVDD